MSTFSRHPRSVLVWNAPLLLMAHACACSFAHAQTDTMQQVVVSAAATDLRTQSTTTAIIIKREELLHQGDASLADVLKRQPGITADAAPGREAQLRMRGMGSGYVAILLDGVPAPGGFSLESISPDLIERIEIRRAATAETSSQAVAGAINVILRRAGPKKDSAASEFKLGASVQSGHAAPQLLAQHSGKRGALAYTLAATARRNAVPIRAMSIEEGAAPPLLRRTGWTDEQVEDVLELAPRLSWQPNAVDSFSSQSYLRRRHVDNVKRESETTQIGAATRFPRAFQRFETRPWHAYADLAWTRTLDAGARLNAKLSGFHMRREAGFTYRGMDLRDHLLESHLVASGPVEREWTFSGSWRRPLWGRHALAAGWEAGRKDRSEYRRERHLDAAGVQTYTSDEDYRAEVVRGAFFIQDEWDIDADWSAYLGLRREDLRTTGEGNAAAPVDVDAGAWSPVFQALYKPQAKDGGSAPRDGFRIALGRTYKAPSIVQLMPRRYTVDNNNSATNPDQQGNPQLRPELALALDLAWERTFGKADMVSVSAFHKRIRDITLTRLVQQNGIWTATPDNRGNATVRGIEFEARLARGALSARANLARNWSRLDSVPGPDNRIDGQPAWSGNLGLDFAAPARRIDLGGTFSYQGTAPSRAGSPLFSDIGARRQIDLYAVYKRDARTRLRLSLSNLGQRDYRERVVHEGPTPLARTTLFAVRPTLRLVWEQSM